MDLAERLRTWPKEKGEWLRQGDEAAAALEAAQARIAELEAERDQYKFLFLLTAERKEGS